MILADQVRNNDPASNGHSKDSVKKRLVLPRFMPPACHCIDELGIPSSLVLDLVMRRLLVDGTSTLESLSNTLKLSVSVVETVFRQIRQQRLIEVTGAIGDDYIFTLTGAGRSLASERMQISHYAGAAPVSLQEYQSMVNGQAAQVEIDRDTLRAAMSDLVLSDVLLDQLGPAVISQSAIFLYGPPGSGKTSLAERLLRVYEDAILIPYAVEVDGQVITFFDPVVHRKVELDEEFDMDPRWVVCHRPCVMVGGELTADMLELRRDAGCGIYAAPMQMKANNGIFIIDDFGRQIMSPQELLNRWIVPLDRRVDYFTLSYGVKFQVPFQMMVVFSSNLHPHQLGDGAFFRRIQNKIFVDSVSPLLFDEIFHRVVQARNIPCEPDSAEYLRKLCQRGRRELAASYPGEICKILIALNKYEKRAVQMSKSDLERAAALFFASAGAENNGTCAANA